MLVARFSRATAILTSPSDGALAIGRAGTREFVSFPAGVAKTLRVPLAAERFTRAGPRTLSYQFSRRGREGEEPQSSEMS
jgi:hypothetical protein